MQDRRMPSPLCSVPSNRSKLTYSTWSRTLALLCLLSLFLTTLPARALGLAGSPEPAAVAETTVEPAPAPAAARPSQAEGPILLDPNAPWLSDDNERTNSVAWGDVNGDGYLDLAVGNGTPEFPQPEKIYMNNGYQLNPVAGWQSADSDATTSVAWGDVDGDGDIDLAVGNLDAPVKIYLNNQGILDPVPAWQSDEISATTSVAWGDVDGDGYFDLAVGVDCSESSYCASAMIYFNLGGMLETSPGWECDDADTTMSVAWGDVDYDGLLDLAVGNDGQPNKIYFNEGDTLETTASWVADTVNSTQSVAWGNTDGDGDIDLAVGNLGEPNQVYLNVDGVLSTTADWESADSDNTYSVAWGDADGDGDLDLVAGNDSTPIKIYLNEGVTLTGTPAWTATTSNWSRSVAWADVDGDGDLDLAVGNFWQPNMVYLNLDGTLDSIPSWESTEGDTTNNIAWGDVDGDGDLDLAAGNEGSPNRVYMNVDGELEETASWSSDDVSATTSVAWGDVDGDGALDLAASVSCTVAPCSSAKIYMNEGGALATMPGWYSDTGDQAISLAWGDVDGDGDLDLAVGSDGAPNKVYRNQDGTLETTAGWVSADADSTQSVAWRDMDGDGDLDLAVGNQEQPNKVYLNEGGTLNPVAAWQSADDDYTLSVAWADVDGDGDFDLVAGNSGELKKLYINEGGRLNPVASWHAADIDFTSQLAWGDVDGDGDLDLAAANEGGPNKIYRNERGTLNPVAAWTSVYTDATSSVAWGDVDGDGDLDLATGGLDGVNRVYLNKRPSELFYPGETMAVHIGLNSSAVPTFGGQEATALAPADGYATAWIRQDGLVPITYTLFDPAEQTMAVVAYYSVDGGSSWRLAVPTDDTPVGDLEASPYPTVTITNTHVYTWNVLADESDFMGESDDVVVNVVALPVDVYPNPPHTYEYVNETPGPFMRSSVSASTYSFRVRGSQVRVLSGGQPVDGAMVYRRAAGQNGLFEPYQDQTGRLYRTDSQGYLQGRGTLGVGDELVALYPVSATSSYTICYSNAIPTNDGLQAYEVQSPGLQALSVSPDHVLVLFNLDVSLEWDARGDGTFLNDLSLAFQHASDVLYDVSNGQAAIGTVRLYQNKENWSNADVVVYAQNGIRPRASMGGAVEAGRDEVDRNGTIIHNAYVPGQVRMGPNWDPFGMNLTELSQDWQRALAHELSHYFLFLPDNYIGSTPDGLPIRTDCRGSFMTSTYDDSYSEFLTTAQWTGECLQTVAERITGRNDWETVVKYYDMLITSTAVMTGPQELPLAVTSLSYVPITTTQPLPSLIADLRDAGSGTLLPVRRAQGYLFKTNGNADPTDDSVIGLGSTVGGGDRIKVRGADAGDRLCLFGPLDPRTRSSYVGCIDSLVESSRSVPMAQVQNWAPNIVATSINSTTMAITVTLDTGEDELYAQFYPAYGSPTSTNPVYAPVAPMQPVGATPATTFTQVLTLTDPAFEGWVRVWVPGSDPPREALSQVFLSPPWGPNQDPFHSGGNVRAWGANQRQLGAPVASGDGEVTIFNLQNIFSDTGTVSLQAVNTLPNLPAWLTPVGQGYRFRADAVFPRAIAIDYLQRDVPEGYEYTLRIYYSPDEGQTWRRLATSLDTTNNQATAQMPDDPATGHGQGIYALLSTLEMPPLQVGWNLFGYPLPGSRPVEQALASIDGAYDSVYYYDPEVDRWRLHDEAVPDFHPAYVPLVNDLETLDFGRSYWLYATEAITLYLGVPISGEGVLDLPPQPPATFYGPVNPAAGLNPTVGMTVSAMIGGRLCGQGVITDGVSGVPLAYQVRVAADTGNGCGTLGRTISFVIAGQAVGLRPWDNQRAEYLALPATVYQIYLPIVVKGSR